MKRQRTPRLHLSILFYPISSVLASFFLKFLYKKEKYSHRAVKLPEPALKTNRFDCIIDVINKWFNMEALTKWTSASVRCFKLRPTGAASINQAGVTAPARYIQVFIEDCMYRAKKLGNLLQKKLFESLADY